MYQKGQIVKSLAGRDKGNLLVVICTKETYVFVCDGKERPLDNPKRKNPRHIESVGMCISDNQMASDRALRKALAAIKAVKQ